MLRQQRALDARALVLRPLYRSAAERSLLKQVGVGPKAREVVFFGTDRGTQDVVFRKQTFNARTAVRPQHHAGECDEAGAAAGLCAERRSADDSNRVSRVRLIMPGWYGVANVKWLSEIHLQEDRFLGNFQARWYRSLVGVGGTGAENDPETQWVENGNHADALEIGDRSRAQERRRVSGLGFALNDGTPLKSVEVQIDDGPWQTALFASSNSKYSWKLFTYRWEGATPGEHTLVSRATDADGHVQPAAADLKTEEDFPRGQRPVPAQSYDRLSELVGHLSHHGYKLLRNASTASSGVATSVTMSIAGAVQWRLRRFSTGLPASGNR